MLEDQLLLRSGFQEDGKLVETSNPSSQLCTIQQIDYDRSLLTSDRIEESVLYILWCLFPVGHFETWEAYNDARLQSDYNTG